MQGCFAISSQRKSVGLRPLNSFSMKHSFAAALFVSIFISFAGSMVFAQKITLETIMQDPKWLGTIPKDPMFSADGKSLLFYWNPDKELNDALWQCNLSTAARPFRKTSAEALREQAAAIGNRNRSGDAIVYVHKKELIVKNLKTGKERIQLQMEPAPEMPRFLYDGRIGFLLNNQPFILDQTSGEIRQLLEMKTMQNGKDKKNAQDSLLAASEMQLFTTLRRRKEKQENRRQTNKPMNRDTLPVFNLRGKEFSLPPNLSPDGIFLAFQLQEKSKYTTANVPSYINASGYSIEIPTRENVGIREGSQDLYILNTTSNQFIQLSAEDLPGIQQQPDFYKDYPKLRNLPPTNRTFYTEDIRWNENGDHLLADVRSRDNKDRWLMLWEKQKNAWKVADHQRDEAWIGGPAAEGGSFGFTASGDIWYLSEASGFSHLNLFQPKTGEKKTLSSGRFEVSNVQYSKTKNSFYFIANPEHAGEHSVYRLRPGLDNGPVKITSMKGGHEFILSPDEQTIAYRFSTATRPWELYYQALEIGAKPVQITNSGASSEYLNLNVKEPEYLLIPAEDGAKIPARLYRPDKANVNKAAVIFVHGAGYLQNAHKHWSHYFREFLFHQMLAAEGFTILDLDYRGSAGYGKNWRTGIYRHMGGKDLSDQTSGARYLTKELGIEAQRIGIYGGSYGGFITLMALCTKPGSFACGAALRSVTDWMHYNHGYTSRILNNPLEDSLAYRRSSPIYFAEGLQGKLLMCHGMQDLNVHYQDIVRFSQRLIELRKQNWELASYPLEDHAFTEPESWLDEYRRIHKLFREELLKQ